MRKTQLEACAGVGGDEDKGALVVGEFACDGQAQPGAPAVAGAGVDEPDEAFEDAFGVLGGYARPGTVDGQDDVLVLGPDGELDAACGMAGGIVDEVASCT